MTKTLDFLNKKEEEYMKQDRDANMFHIIPNSVISDWVDELHDIRLNELCDDMELKQKIDNIIKEGTLDICPSCNKPTKVYPNPMYMHKCDVCGWEGSYNECSFSYVEDRIVKLFKPK